MTLGKTCRYCAKCELIVVHQDELEAEMAYKFQTLNPEIIGNDYLILGTVDKKFWQQHLTKTDSSLDEMVKHTADFKKYLDFEYQPAGWYLDDGK